MTLEEYLRQAVAAGATDFRIRVHAVNGPGLPGTPGAKPVTTFYIHPHGKDGMTVDYAVHGDLVEHLGQSK